MSAKGYLNTGKRKFKRVKYREFYEGHGKNGLFGKGMNCDLVSGGIYPAMETELFVLNGKTSAVYGATDGIMKIARAERNGFIEKNFAYLTGGGYLHSFNFVEDGFNGVGHRFVKTPEIFNVFEKDGDEIVVFASRDGVVLYDFIGGVETVLWTASSAAFCFHDRIFAGYQSDLYFSAHQDYRNFTESTDEGGKISLPSEKGYIVGGCVVGENCYLIFQRGIMKLTATGAARDFVIEEVPYDGAEIVPASAKPVGQYLFFLTREGPVRFDGKRSEKICEEMDIRADVSEFTCDCAVFEGRVYVSYRDENKQKKMFVADVGKGKGFFLSPDVWTGLSVSDGMLLCACNERFAKVVRGGTQKTSVKRRFEVKDFDFETVGEKLLKKVSLKGGGKVYVTFYGKRGSKDGTVFALDLTDGEDGFYPLLKGDRFSFTIELGEGGFVTELEAEIAVFS